jgi:uncharacterized protein YjbJ (UPF0337 family)
MAADNRGRDNDHLWLKTNPDLLGLAFAASRCVSMTRATVVYLQGTNAMSTASKRTEGAAEEFLGWVENVAGRLIGNEEMLAAGKARQLKGKAITEAAKGLERTKGLLEKVVGAANYRVGALLGNRTLQAKGAAAAITGEARQHAND